MNGEIKMNKEIEEVKRELKRVASIKCRLKKMVGRVGTEEKLIEVEKYESELKSKRDNLLDRKKYVTEYEQEDVDALNYEEVCKAINSIKSKKSLSKWLSPVEGDNDEYRNAVRIEEMLYRRKEALGGGRKNIKNELKDLIENSGDISKEDLIEKLKDLL